MKNLFNNQWFRTILSTMIGIIAGLYITNAFENRKLVKAKNAALEQVSIEITNNRDTLQIYQDTLTSLFNACEYVFPLIDDDEGIIIHKDSLDSFIHQSKRIFIYTKSESQSADSLVAKGELSLYVTNKLVLLDLTRVTWDAFLNANLQSVTPFECLRDVEDLYTLQNDIVEVNKRWRDSLFGQEFIEKSDSRNSFLALWRMLLLKQRVLLQFYEAFEEEEIMENCS